MEVFIITLYILSILIIIGIIIGMFIMFNKINIICDCVEEINENLETIVSLKVNN